MCRGRQTNLNVRKEYLLIRVLHDNANRLVPLEEIKSRVWPERSTGAEGFSDVTLDELNALIYRVRKIRKSDIPD